MYTILLDYIPDLNKYIIVMHAHIIRLQPVGVFVATWMTGIPAGLLGRAIINSGSGGFGKGFRVGVFGFRVFSGFGFGLLRPAFLLCGVLYMYVTAEALGLCGVS